MIRLVNVSKTYDGEPALHPLTLTIEAGAVTVLIGPSGCGKSTCLRLIAGLVRPDTGHVEVAGARLAPDNARRLRHQIGYVIQGGGLFPHLTARENVTLLARHLGQPARAIAARVSMLADLVHLSGAVLDRPPDQLSGGQRQRVSLMRALMLDPEVLLLDEPLGALDPMIRAELQDELAGIFRALGKTVVLVTHDLAEAGFFGDTVVLLRAGRVVQHGSFPTLVEHPATDFARRFVSAQRRMPREALDAP